MIHSVFNAATYFSILLHDAQKKIRNLQIIKQSVNALYKIIWCIYSLMTIPQGSKHVRVLSVLMWYNCVNANIVHVSVNYYKGKSKVHPITGHEGPEVEWRYSSTLSLTSALYGGGLSTPRPGRLTKYPLYRRLGGPQGRSGEVRKISPPPPTGIRCPDRPARSESLYRLRYPGPLIL